MPCGAIRPGGAFSHQVIHSLVLGFSGSDLQSSGNTSTLKLSGSSLFVEVVAGIGQSVDIGAAVAALKSSVQTCLLNPTVCASVDDTGSDLGVFGMVYLDQGKSTSVTLSYDSISYQKSTPQSIIGVSFVTVLAEHLRLALSADTTQDSSGKSVSGGYGFGYSYLF